MQQILDGGEMEGLRGRAVLVDSWVGGGEGIDLCRHQVAGKTDAWGGGGEEKRRWRLFFCFRKQRAFGRFGYRKNRAHLNSPQRFFVRVRGSKISTRAYLLDRV
jgi:hypothetical protein